MKLVYTEMKKIRIGLKCPKCDVIDEEYYKYPATHDIVFQRRGGFSYRIDRGSNNPTFNTWHPKAQNTTWAIISNAEVILCREDGST